MVINGVAGFTVTARDGGRGTKGMKPEQLSFDTQATVHIDLMEIPVGKQVFRIGWRAWNHDRVSCLFTSERFYPV